MIDREKRTRIEIAVGLDTPALTPAELAGLIDHTYLKAFGDAKVLERLFAEAAAYRFASVAVNGCEVARCAAALRGTGVKVTAVAGFPLGQMTTEAKLFEVHDALAKGAGVTALIQSSSATSVMTVGFVNAGLLSLEQTIGVIFG